MGFSRFLKLAFSRLLSSILSKANMAKAGMLFYVAGHSVIID